MISNLRIIMLKIINNGIFEKAWAVILFTFQWQKGNSWDILNFRSGFT